MLDIFTFLVIITASCFAGLISGMLGVGGGIVLVPVIYWLLNNIYGFADYHIHIAVTVSLANIIFTGSLSFYTHITKGNFDKTIFKNWLFFICTSSFLGGVISIFIRPIILVWFFGLFLLLVSYLMWRREVISFPGWFVSSRLCQRIFSFSNGFFSSLIGIGGGSFSVPFMSGCRVPIRVAIGTSSGFGVLIGLFSLPGHIYAGLEVSGLPYGSIGYFNFVIWLPVVLSSSLFAPLGAHIISYIDGFLLRRLFAILLFLVSLKLLLDVI